MLAIPFLTLSASVAISAPSIQGATGKIEHGASVTILGSGFGTKATAAPVIWDDASGTSIQAKWSGAWPNSSSNATYNTSYKAPMRGIPLPHSHVTKYIAGAHGESGGFSSGYNVMLYKTRTISSYPYYTYMSWYQRADDNWVFGLGSPADDNFKTFDFSTGTTPYGSGGEWYMELRGTPTSKTASTAWHGNILPDNDSSNWWWSGSINPMSGRWSKVELEIKYSNQKDGYVKLWENGVQKVNYTGTTDNYSGTTRTEAIGGYARAYGNANNWRYFADVYVDYTPARIVLANNANLASATVVESQVPSGWSANSVTVAVNLGQFAAGQKAYLFAFDASGARNAVGFPVTVGADANAVVPNAPSVLTAQ